jgi:hypothetical protein
MVEIIPSRWDDEPIIRAQSALSGLAGTEGFSLEFAASDGRLRCYLRARSADVMQRVQGHLNAAHPQVNFKTTPTSDHADVDPAWRAPGEEMASVQLRLRRGPNLPIASDWRHTDPLGGIIAGISAALSGERIVCQLVLAAAPAGWADRLRSKVGTRDARPFQRNDSATPQDILPLVALFGIGAIAFQGYAWYQSGNFLPLIAAGAAGIVGLPLTMALAARFLAGRQPVPAELVEEKLAHPSFATQLRIVAYGPSGTDRKRLSSLIGAAAGAYHAFDHPAGNGLRTHRWRGDPTQPVAESGLFREPQVLNAAELAGLWHLPCDTPAPLTGERAASRKRLAETDDTDRGCRVGVSGRQAAVAPVQIPGSLLYRNHLVVAKTRRGKSTLLLHVASFLMDRMASPRQRVALVVVDPHQDLAEAVLGAVPPTLEDEVIYLNLADRERPPGLNLLDVSLFPNRDRTSENIIAMMHRLWPDNWGPRMEGALRASLSCLHEANVARAPENQYTLLDVVPMLMSTDFREGVLKQVPDKALWVWWRDNYDRISRTFQQQIANPVTTKVGRFVVNEASRLVIGQPRSTIDPRTLVKDGGVLVINSAVGSLGEGAAALMGATLLNLLSLVVEEQINLAPAERCRLVALVDESSTLAAADYQRMLSELSKYGASFILVSQSLAKLDAIDRALRPTIFSNIDGLTVFQVSAEDGRYLVPELGSDIEVSDLTDLSDFECYARWWADGRRLPTFSLRLDPPPAFHAERVQSIARRSAERFGRPRQEVLAEIDRVLAEHGGLAGTPAAQGWPTLADGQAQDPTESETSPTSRVNPRPQFSKSPGKRSRRR